MRLNWSSTIKTTCKDGYKSMKHQVTMCARGADKLASAFKEKKRLTLLQKILLAILLPPWITMMAGVEFLLHMLGIPHWH